MSESALPVLDAAPRREGPFQRFCRGRVEAALGRLESGGLVLADGACEQGFGDSSRGLGGVRVEVRNPEVYPSLFLGGVVGAAESYIRGEWHSDDLPRLVQLLLQNRAAVEGLEGPLSRLAEVPRRALHRWRRNTRAGSGRNIRAHYDLGNDFFAAFLDATLTYSAGIFERPDASMEEASQAKYARLCRKLALRPEHEVLEIGCGWGGFALYAAEHVGCRVTSTTISPSQHAVAVARVKEAGLEDRVEVLLEDYRDLEGRFDRLVSIEMVEAVGHEYYETYLRTCADRLHPDGAAALQAILISDQHYDSARRRVDFIKRYIFPGGNLPSLTRLCEAATRASDLRIFDLHDITRDYAETLRRWRSRFEEQRERIASLGYGEDFRRMWDFYLAYCEAGFLERHITCTQLVLGRPNWRPPWVDAR
ncbi:MAG: cyclopropane-fatty-acyl-phospholipid synthase family protein [Proteobacteria bacterium]|nr:cyclopropane-fatty-acyl-phospholipid synthase family protein [Pseudomonadota bacterium]